MPQRSHRWYWILIGVLVVLGLPNACQKDDPVRPAPTADTRISLLQADRTVLGTEDSTVVRARVVQGPEPGTPVPGASVFFSETPGVGSGTFSKDETVTAADGWATGVFRPSGETLGMVTLRAQAGGSIAYVLLEVRAITQDASALAVATPDGQTGLPADGAAELEITVTATTGPARAPITGLQLVLAAGDQFVDGNNNGVYDAGETIPAGGDRNGDGRWTPEGSLPEQVLTDEHGVARFHYRAGAAVGPVYVRITGAGLSREITLQQHSLALVVTLDATVDQLLADGVSQTPVTVRVHDWAETPVAGVIVRLTAGEPFTDTNANGFYDAVTDSYEDRNHNGRWDTMGTLASSATTAGDGSATVVYTAGLAPDTTVIRATTTGGFGTMNLTLVEVPPARRLAVGLDRVQTYADGRSTVDGSVTVSDLAEGGLAGKSVTVVAGERFGDVNADGSFTPGVDQLLDDADGNGTWTPAGVVTVHGPTGADGRVGFTVAVGRVAMAAWVHAAVDGVVAETRLDLVTPPPVQTVTLESASPQMTVTGGGGVVRNALTATCSTSAGSPVPEGTVVSFRIFAGPGGGERLEGAVAGQVDVATDPDGKAVAWLLSGNRIGAVRVSATCAGVSGNADTYLGPGGPAFLTCAADSTQLAPHGESQVRVWVYDTAHNPVVDGTAVRFRVDEGTVRGGDGAEVSYTANGVAVAIYTALPAAGGDGEARITASTIGSAGGNLECTSVIRVSGGLGASCRVTVEPLLPEIGVRGTGAVEQTIIRARVYDCRDLPVRDGVPVAFVIAQGPGGGETLACCQCDSVVIPTDAGGTAEVTLKAGIRSGTVLVRARVLSPSEVAAHTPVAIAAGPPAYVSVGVDFCNVLTCTTVADKNNVTALVYDTYHNPVRDGTAVFFTCNFGMVTGAEELGSAVTRQGFAKGTWYSTGWPECGLVTITASTSGGLLSSPVSFIGSGPPYSARYTSPAGDTIVMNADGSTKLPLRIEVLDFNGLFTLPATVDLTAVYGDIGSVEKSDDGCSASIARAIYTAPILLQDFSFSAADTTDDGIGGLDSVPVSAGFGPQGDLLSIELHTGPASASKSVVELEAMPPSAQSFFTVTVKDVWGNPLGGHRLSLTASGGTITPSIVTDAYGMAIGSFTAPAIPGSVMVEIRDLDPVYSGNMILRKTVSIAL